ncbi:MAG: hypothetical protein GX661_00830, partial [Acholeplasmataceae bacterium]|nr:hypothetical protein [Acholeplasmataceae bacterium]
MNKISLLIIILNFSIFSGYKQNDSIYMLNLITSYNHSLSKDRIMHLPFDDLQLFYPINHISLNLSLSIIPRVHPLLGTEFFYGSMSDIGLQTKHNDFMADSKRYGFYIYPGIKIYVLKIKRISIAGEIKMKYGWAHEDIRAHDLFNQKVIDLFSYTFSGFNCANGIETSIEYRIKSNTTFALAVGYQRSFFKEADSYDGN